MQIIAAQQAPAAVGPYSHAVRTGALVFCSGQLGLEPRSGRLVDGGIAEQTRQALANLAAVLEAAGCSLARVVKTTVYLADMNDFPVMNAEYGQAFGSHKPARSTVEVARLPKDALVEIECVAETC